MSTGDASFREGQRRSADRRSPDARWHWIKVRWDDAAGQEREAEGAVDRIYDSTSKGDRVPIVYLLQQAGDATVPGFAFVDEPPSVGGIIGCFVFSLVFLGVGIAAFMGAFGGGGE